MPAIKTIGRMATSNSRNGPCPRLTDRPHGGLLQVKRAMPATGYCSR